MNRLPALFRFRYLRWVACAAVIPALWACNSRKLAAPDGVPAQVVKNRFQQSINRDLDLMFVIDDSSSMLPLQAKMQMRLPDFMNVLKGLPGGLPNIHVAVVSSSLGAGIFGNVNGCLPGSLGNLEGKFQHSAACAGLNAGERFISSVVDPTSMQRVENFTGDITDVFSCIAQLGQGGCGFEHQFASTIAALQKAASEDGDNGGFLRQDAYLAIVMLTNEDDCSVPSGSGLFDPSVQTLADVASAQNPTMAGVQLGGLQSYRCNEFGHLCNGMKPPHVPPPAGMPVTLDNCVSAEDQGALIPVDGPSGFTTFIRSLKSDPNQILVAALAGLPVDAMNRSLYRIQSNPFLLGNGSMEAQPQMVHSCMQAAGEYANPGVRIKQWLDNFGANGVLESICANDFAPAMVRIAQVIGRALGAQCVPNNIADKADGTPDCDVTKRVRTGNKSTDSLVPYCNVDNNLAAATSGAPCWRFGMSTQCANSQLLELCFEPACVGNKPTSSTDALISCVLANP